MAWEKLFNSKLAKVFKNAKTFLFGAEPKIVLSNWQEAGPKILRTKPEVYSKDGKLLATIENYTQKAKNVGSDNKIFGYGSINQRVYTPAENSELANMGILSVTTNRLVNKGVSAVVRMPNGATKTLNGIGSIRNYVGLMKV